MWGPDVTWVGLPEEVQPVGPGAFDHRDGYI